MLLAKLRFWEIDDVKFSYFYHLFHVECWCNILLKYKKNYVLQMRPPWFWPWQAHENKCKRQFPNWGTFGRVDGHDFHRAANAHLNVIKIFEFDFWSPLIVILLQCCWCLLVNYVLWLFCQQNKNPSRKKCYISLNISVLKN